MLGKSGGASGSVVGGVSGTGDTGGNGMVARECALCYWLCTDFEWYCLTCQYSI